MGGGSHGGSSAPVVGHCCRVCGGLVVEDFWMKNFGDKRLAQNVHGYHHVILM